MPTEASGPDWTAIAGAITGSVGALIAVVALVRTMRQGARLYVMFYVYHHVDLTPGGHIGPVAIIRIVNVGTLPAYITEVRVAEKLPWKQQWPFLRSRSYRARKRRPLRWVFGSEKTVGMTLSRYPTDPEVDTLEAGQAVDLRLKSMVNEELTWMDDTKVEGFLDPERQWAVVATGIRQYVAKVIDNRPDN
jgi:hypothetical protein